MEQAIQAAGLRVKDIAPLVDSGGRQLISDSLCGTREDPWQPIAPLQQKLSYNLPVSDCALKLLVAMESDQASVSVSLFESLSSHLDSLVGTLSQEGLEHLLRETIQYISIKELKAVPISIMKKMKIIPAEYLTELIASDTLSNFPIDVRRQAWQTEQGKSHYIKTVDDILWEGGEISSAVASAGGNTTTAGTNPAAVEAKKVEIHAKSISDMIMHSKPLFDAFADHCSERTTTLYLEKCAAIAAAVAKRDRSDVSSQSSLDLSAMSGSQAPSPSLRASTVAAAAPSRNLKYNYAALLQRVLMALQEANRKVKFCEALHDFATLLDRGKRSNSLDNAAVKSLFDTFKRMHTACLTTHLKNWKEIEDAYWQPRGGKPAAGKEKKGIPQLSSNAASKSKMKTARPAGAPKAAKAKPNKSLKRSFIQDDDEDVDTNSESEVDGDDLSDTERGASVRSGSVKRARLSKVSAPRKRARKVDTLEDSDGESAGEGNSKDKAIELNVLEPMIQEALDHLLSYDHNGDFAMEITDAIAPGYSAEIKVPMDLTKMQCKLDTHQYSSLKQFDSDVQLMVRNCRKFNGAASPYTKTAQFLQREWARRLDDFQDRLAYGTVPLPAPVSKKASAPKAKKASTPAVALPASSANSASGVRAPSSSVRAGMTRLLQQMKDLESDLSTGELVRSVLNLAWEYLTLVDEKKTFALPVSDRIAPGYSKIIKKKMALSNMKTKIYRGDYSTIEDFQEDVQLIVDNCRKFNAGAEEYVRQALAFLVAWQEFYKETSARWPAVTAREQTGDNDEEEEEDDNVSVSGSAADLLPTSIVLNAQAGIKVKIPPEGHGRYLKENDNIELPHILTAEQIRELVAGKDPQSQAAQRSIMSAGWNYLTELDEDGYFAAPVMLLDYLKTITSPMDLSTIKLKMDRRKYRTIAEFNADVTLMLHNCLHYNEEGSEVSVWAEYLLFAWHLCKQNIESVMRSDPSLAVELLPPHTIGSNDDDEAEADLEQEKVVAQPVKKEKSAPVVTAVPAAEPRSAASKASPVSATDSPAAKSAKVEVQEAPLTIKLKVGGSKAPVIQAETQRKEKEPVKIEEVKEEEPVKIEEVKEEVQEEVKEEVKVEEVKVELEQSPAEISGESTAMEIVEEAPSTTAIITPVTTQEAVLVSPTEEKTPVVSELLSEAQGPNRGEMESPSSSADSPVVVKAPSRRPVYPSSSSPASSSQSFAPSAYSNLTVSPPKPTAVAAPTEAASASSSATQASHSAEPQPPSMLVSLEDARVAIETPRYLLNGRMVYELTGSWSSSDLIPLHQVDLPYVLGDAQLRWALALLRDFSVQALLRKQFAMSLRDLIVKSSDVKDINQAKADAANTIGHFANKVFFPHGSATCRQLFQLCQMSLTYGDRIDGMDEHVLRVYIPLLVYCTVKPTAETTPAAPPAATGAERSQLLNTTARALVKEVLEHPAAADNDIFKRSGFSSCFSERAVLREFLESVAKHLINMKLKG